MDGTAGSRVASEGTEHWSVVSKPSLAARAFRHPRVETTERLVATPELSNDEAIDSDPRTPRPVRAIRPGAAGIGTERRESPELLNHMRRPILQHLGLRWSAGDAFGSLRREWSIRAKAGQLDGPNPRFRESVGSQ